MTDNSAIVVGALIGAGATACLILIISIGVRVSDGAVIDECERNGFFERNEQIYMCKRMERQ